ncbi:MAG: DinB family protein [Gemmatimonadaceae bacterium]
MAMSIAAAFLERSRYYLVTEYSTKIRAAVESLPPEKLWWRPNEQANSVGNLLLHLSGNLRQWLISGVGGVPDVRKRNMEFATRGGAPASQMLDMLDTTIREADAVLRGLTPSELTERRLIQGRDTTVFEAVYHVVEHFSGHTGQIILLAKMFVPGAIRFYEDGDGIAVPVFLGDGKWEMGGPR